MAKGEQLSSMTHRYASIPCTYSEAPEADSQLTRYPTVIQRCVILREEYEEEWIVCRAEKTQIVELWNTMSIYILSP